MDDLARFCCQNPDCPDHGCRDLGNLTVCGRYGKEPFQNTDRCAKAVKFSFR